MPASKLPAIQFYPGDWLRDHVAGCSVAAQGLWLRIMILMHDSERYGYLSINGSPILPSTLARRCGCDSQAQFDSLWDELVQAGVPSKTDDGVFYSRRMVRDARQRAGNAERQSRLRERGGGSPQNWPAVRAKILERDGRLCAYCGEAAITVDHILPKTRGGTESPANLAACCKPCNNKKSNRTPEEAGMKFRDGYVTPKCEDEVELKLKIGRLFRRRGTTPWSWKEETAFKTLLPIDPDDLAAVERYYSEAIPKDKDFRRRDLLTLLNNWSGEVDRARGRMPARNGQNTQPKPQPEGWSAWRQEHYPDAKEKDFWRAPGDVQTEFKNDR